MESKLRIGYFSNHNYFSRNDWSSIPYYMREALQEVNYIELMMIGDHTPPGWKHKFKKLRPQAQICIENNRKLDWTVCVASSGRVPELRKITGSRIVHVTDATPGFLREYYGWKLDSGAETREQEALSVAEKIVYPSHYMAERAAAELGEHFSHKMEVIPFGVNLDHAPDQAPLKPALSPLKLLFVGRDWTRKGGHIALEAVNSLKARGIAVELTIIGCRPEVLADKTLRILGSLNKDKPREMRVMEDCYRSAHLFILPTQADCSSMVTAEANAYGVPVLITDVGGIGSIVKPGVNGYMLPLGANGEDYATRIMEIIGDEGSYRALKQSSFQHYRETLNWNSWASKIISMMKRAMPPPATVGSA